MSEKKLDYNMRKVAKTWTSPRLYEIVKGKKVVLKLKDEDDARQVLDYLNGLKCDGKKGGAKKSTKKSAKSSSKKK